jgi:hypothetical protein
MGVSDIIQQAKDRFFQRKDANNIQTGQGTIQYNRDVGKDLALQKQLADIRKEREQIESQRQLKADLQNEKRALYKARAAPALGLLQNAKSGFKRLQENTNRFDNQPSKSSGGPFSPSASGPFATGGPAGLQPIKSEPKPKARTITIKLQP